MLARIFPVFCLVPFFFVLSKIIWGELQDESAFGPDPGKELVLLFGEIAVICLIITLMVSPLRNLFHVRCFPEARRILGLSVFFYATLHFFSYIALLKGLDFKEFVIDLETKTHIFMGFFSYCMLIPLAFTSSDSIMKRLKYRWKILHGLVYLISGSVIIHVFVSVRDSFQFAYFCSFCLGALLLYRILKSMRKLSFF
ncbi:MAG: sulfoxide reductase heme-binding subunit YedZ [Gammaproteobacteria bacterium]|nr:sulfoxide reductase heme-binding subunit YedZ [Gammaproteobacteria bacterium]